MVELSKDYMPIFNKYGYNFSFKGNIPEEGEKM
jgi:hypothetical protein